ncbi:MAG TPA: PilX N-terminal domain-containing pilus assembly protein [Candidatus Saccharimonadales bacterium]|nr:PilX N-terminal domain-containing pilus assembly protein [Candidatus Saccharimonadales bacterium]
MHYRKSKHIDQKGFASIVVALILIIVLGLLTVGFAQLARREQKDTLNKQLAIQANYAAEAGINDIYQKIKTGVISDSALPYSSYPGALNGTYCLTDPDTTHVPSLSSIGLNNSIGGNSNAVAYTCPLVDLNPTTLEKDPLPPNSYWNIAFTTTNPLDSLTIHWKSVDHTSPYTFRSDTDTDLPPVASWQSPAVLEFSLTPMNSLKRSDLISNDFTTFLYPSGNGIATVPFSFVDNNKGKITNAKCDATTGSCTASITGIGGVAGEYFLLHMTDYYDGSSICVSIGDGTDCVNTAGGANEFKDSQITIDVTGKARDVLKRLRWVVISPSTTTNPNPAPGEPLPDDAIEAQDVCKRINTDPVTGTNIKIPTSYGGDPRKACDIN